MESGTGVFACHSIGSLYQQHFPILRQNHHQQYQTCAFLLSYSNSKHCSMQDLLYHFPQQHGGKDKSSGKNKDIIVRPWGGNGGSTWDDGSFNGVREIALVYDRCIDSIRVLYDKKGKPFLAERNGGAGGNKTAEIKLQYPDEFLMVVCGHYCPVVYGGNPVIRSLTFKTNRRTFGSFGVEEGTPFSHSVSGNQIVGMKGRSGWYVDSIALRLTRPKKGLIEKVQQTLKKITT